MIDIFSPILAFITPVFRFDDPNFKNDFSKFLQELNLPQDDSLN